MDAESKAAHNRLLNIFYAVGDPNHSDAGFFQKLIEPKPVTAVGRKFLMDQWWYATFPGLFSLATVIGFNIFGDALRDVLDPRIRR